MSTTNVKFNHTLSGIGFDGRASSVVQLGAVGDYSLHNSTLDSQVCLHPDGGGSTKLPFGATLPSSVPHSPSLMSDLRNKAAGKQIRVMSKGTGTSAFAWSEATVDIEGGALCASDLQLPSDVLQNMANRGIDVGEKKLIVPESTEELRITQGELGSRTVPCNIPGVTIEMRSSYTTWVGLNYRILNFGDFWTEQGAIELESQDFARIPRDQLQPPLTPEELAILQQYYYTFPREHTSVVTRFKYYVFTANWARQLPGLSPRVIGSPTRLVSRFSPDMSPIPNSARTPPLQPMHGGNQFMPAYRGHVAPTSGEWWRGHGYAYTGSRNALLIKEDDIGLEPWKNNLGKGSAVMQPDGVDYQAAVTAIGSHTRTVTAMKQEFPLGGHWTYRQTRYGGSYYSEEPVYTEYSYDYTSIGSHDQQQEGLNAALSALAGVGDIIKTGSDKFLNVGDVFIPEDNTLGIEELKSRGLVSDTAAQLDAEFLDPRPPWLFIGRDRRETIAMYADTGSYGVSIYEEHHPRFSEIEAALRGGGNHPSLGTAGARSTAKQVAEEALRYGWGAMVPHDLTLDVTERHEVTLEYGHTPPTMFIDALPKNTAKTLWVPPGSPVSEVASWPRHYVSNYPQSSAEAHPLSTQLLAGASSTGSTLTPGLDPKVEDGIRFKDWEVYADGRALFLMPRGYNETFSLNFEGTKTVRTKESRHRENNLVIESVEQTTEPLGVSYGGYPFVPSWSNYITKIGLFHAYSALPFSGTIGNSHYRLVADDIDYVMRAHIDGIHDPVWNPQGRNMKILYGDAAAIVGLPDDRRGYITGHFKEKIHCEVLQSEVTRSFVPLGCKNWTLSPGYPTPGIPRSSSATAMIGIERLRFLQGSTTAQAQKGAMRLVNNLALLAHDLGWNVTPAAPGATEVPGTRWFDWKKMAEDILAPNQVVSFNARLSEGRFNSILPGQESMAAVIEAAVHAVAQDQLEGNNGWTAPELSYLLSDSIYFDESEHLAELKANAFNSITSGADESLLPDDPVIAGCFSSLLSYHSPHYDTRLLFNHLELTPTVDNTARSVYEALTTDVESRNITDTGSLDYTQSVLRRCSPDGADETGIAAWFLTFLLGATGNGRNMIEGIIKLRDAAVSHAVAANGLNQKIFPGTDEALFDLHVGSGVGWGGGPPPVPVGTPLGDPGTALRAITESGFNGYGWELEFSPTVVDQGSSLDDMPGNPWTKGLVYTDGFSLDDTLMTDPSDGTVKTAAQVMAGASASIVGHPEYHGITGTNSYSDFYALRDNGALTHVQRPLTLEEQASGIADGSGTGTTPSRSGPWELVGDGSVSYDMTFVSDASGSTDWGDIVEAAAGNRRSRPSSVSMRNSCVSNVLPRVLQIPEDFNMLTDPQDDVDTIGEVELGLVPYTGLYVPTPTTNSLGEVAIGMPLLTSQYTNPFVTENAARLVLGNAQSAYTSSGMSNSHLWTALFGYAAEGPGDARWLAEFTHTESLSEEKVTDVYAMSRSFDLDITWDDTVGSGIWLANGNVVFDGSTELTLYNRDKSAGLIVNAIPDGLAGNPETQVNDSLLVRHLKDRLPTLNASVDADGSHGLQVGSEVTPAGIHTYSGNNAAHAVAQGGGSSTFTPVDAGGSSEISVYPGTPVAETILYYSYDVAGETKYMYPVYMSSAAAVSADLAFGGTGDILTYGIYSDGNPPVIDGTGTQIYLPATADTDIRDTLSRRLSHTADVNFRYHTAEVTKLLDTFFVGLLEAEDLDSEVYPESTDATIAAYTWNQIKALLTRPESGGEESDPDPGRRLAYEREALELSATPGEPSYASADQRRGLGSEDELKAIAEALRPRGSRLASKFRPGYIPVTPVNPETLAAAYEQGLARLAGPQTSFMDVPEDDPHIINDRYLRKFQPHSQITSRRIALQ